MTTIIFVEANGREIVAKVDREITLMELAVAHNVEGVLAECGGACVCATCHCQPDASYNNLIEEPDPVEQMMLDGLEHVTDQSRLACQIAISSKLDGLIVKVPAAQW